MCNQSLLILIEGISQDEGCCGTDTYGRNLFTNLSVRPVFLLSCENCWHAVNSKWIVCLVQCVFSDNCQKQSYFGESPASATPLW